MNFTNDKRIMLFNSDYRIYSRISRPLARDGHIRSKYMVYKLLSQVDKAYVIKIQSNVGNHLQTMTYTNS